jgi:hypothetical protein
MAGRDDRQCRISRTADGAITANGSNGVTWNGKIDASGKISGGSNGGGGCTVIAVWQK